MSFILELTENKQRLFNLTILYFALTVLALGVDGISFSTTYFDGRWITNTMTVVYFFLMYRAADGNLKKLMLVMVALSFLGELIFCNLFGMYVYRKIHIPLYVPFGHAIVYAAGYSISETDFVKRNTKLLRKILHILFAIIFIGAAVFFKDYFSLISGFLFFLILKRKKWDLRYSCIAVCVMFIELVGTHFGCWAWVSDIFGVIATVNPPLGAVCYYAGGDVLLAKIVDKFMKIET